MLSGLLEELVGKEVTVFMQPLSFDGMAGLHIVKGRLLQNDAEHGALLIQESSGAHTVVNWCHTHQIEERL